MYRSHYNLAKKPFQLSTDPKFLWLGEKHKEALATLKYGVIDQKGFLLVSGDVGTGKTTLINALLESIEEDTLVANITDPALNLIEFFNFVALSFNIPKKFDSKIDFIVYFSQFLKKVYSENRSVLLIIDEVHSLSKKVLEHIRLLSNIELPEEKLINIFFVGQNEIHQTLALPECSALRQRISLVYQIEPLSENETLAYIKHRLKVAGTEKNIFTQNAVQEIYHFSKGYPRLINTICDHALLTGYARELIKITPNVIQECAQQFNSIGEARSNIHSISHKQPHSECRSHSITCPFVKDITEEATSSENTGSRIFILPQAENIRKHLNAKEETQVFTLHQTESAPKRTSAQDKTRNHSADASKDSLERRSQKKKFSWTPVVSLATRMRKKLVSGCSAAVPFIKRMQKSVFSWISAVVSFTKRVHKKMISWASTAVPFIKRMQKKLVSLASAASLPTFLRKRRFFWTSAVSLALMILAITGLYQKALTTKNSPPPDTLALKTTAPSPSKPHGHLTSHNAEIKDAKTTPDHQRKAPSPEKTEISKPNVLEQAKTALHRKNYNRAIELFEHVMAQDPTHAPAIKMYYSKALQGHADSVFIENPGKGEILLSKAIEVDPQNAQAYFDLGKFYTKSKDYPKAIKAYQKAVDLSYRPSDAFYNLGFIYASTKDLAHAERMFLHVADLKPPYLDKVLFNLAVVQQKLGKKQQCIENLEKAVTYNPKNQRAQQYLNQLKNDKEVS
ncbi:MAG: Flp pilus assembly complex ATPase component TadA [Deltaproteobacteria bacterium]|nr:Flp pilus assembly complex ATPase component TadA [Deltaproteobacteria bacterium]